MKARRRSSGSSSRVRFSGSERSQAHGRWYRTVAEHFDHLYDSGRVTRAYPFLHDLFRRRAPVLDVLDVACGTFALDLPLLRRSYRVTGRDVSKEMLRIARRRLEESGRSADLGQADMRTLRLDREFDAILCLGTAFNYLAKAIDIRRALRGFRGHVRKDGLLVLDLTNFDAWIRNPQNARAEVDYRAPDGMRIAVFGFNEQDLTRSIHLARFLTVVQTGRGIDIRFDEAPLRIWTKDSLTTALQGNGFKPVEWWGDLRLGARYDRRRSPRLVSVSTRA
ncbi:MAG: class I SAM-dependent methyltransferase [Methanobacteriota archaeon]|nr:MAG: class I SAM-dependent methyltransferase [Euryarchaeota archaeon]